MVTTFWFWRLADHVISMSCACDSHVLCMGIMHLLCMWYLCAMHVLPMHCACDAYSIFISESRIISACMLLKVFNINYIIVRATLQKLLFNPFTIATVLKYLVKECWIIICVSLLELAVHNFFWHCKKVPNNLMLVTEKIRGCSFISLVNTFF